MSILHYGVTTKATEVHVLRPGCETGTPWTLCGEVLDAIFADGQFAQEQMPCLACQQHLDRVCLYCQETRAQPDGFCSDRCREAARDEMAVTAHDNLEAEEAYERWRTTHPDDR